jgi:prevent-host-death family protein
MEVNIMLVNSTEFKNKVGLYLKLAKNEEVIILKNGRQIVKLVPVDDTSTPITKKLKGMFKECGNVDLDKVRNERLEKNEGSY